MGQKIREDFKKKGSKHFIEILKGEFKGITLNVKVNVAGKQKNMGKATDAIVNILRFVMSSNSPVLGFAGTWQLINQVIEQAGLDPVDFSGLATELKAFFSQQSAPQPSPVQPAQVKQPQYV